LKCLILRSATVRSIAYRRSQRRSRRQPLGGNRPFGQSKLTAAVRPNLSQRISTAPVWYGS
jgi:hypothetical protein